MKIMKRGYLRMNVKKKINCLYKFALKIFGRVKTVSKIVSWTLAEMLFLLLNPKGQLAYALAMNGKWENGNTRSEFLFRENSGHIFSPPDVLEDFPDHQEVQVPQPLEDEPMKNADGDTSLFKERGLLFAELAHEINNPANFASTASYNLKRDLTKLKTFLLELAGDDVDKEILAAFDEKFDNLKDHADTIQEGVSRIRDIVHNVNASFRGDKEEITQETFMDGLKSTLNLVKTAYSDRVDFVVDFKAAPGIQCNISELNQVFMNLMVNGCQAIAQKQDITGDDTKGTLVIRTREENGRVVIDFQDTGIGMTETVKEKVFDRFFTTKPEDEGTGLGLSITYGIIRKHRGLIEIESEPGNGTTVTLYLPQITKASAVKTRDN